MWLRLDDGIASHPKILKAGPLALALQIRALCYASQNRTDGFLPCEVVPMLQVGIDIPVAHMVECHLWDTRENGFNVHNYLKWNFSNKQYESIKRKLSKAGRKGMNSRWKRDNKGYNPPYSPPYNKTITPPSISISRSRSSLNPLNSSGSGSDPDPDPKSTKHSRKTVRGRTEETALPEAWLPNTSHHKLAAARGLDLPIEAAHFSGKARELAWTTKDWNQKFTNWMLQEIKFRQRRPR